MFIEHCHNTMHEDNAMLLRWDINTDGEPFLSPLPTPNPTPQGCTFHEPSEALRADKVEFKRTRAQRWFGR